MHPRAIGRIPITPSMMGIVSFVVVGHSPFPTARGTSSHPHTRALIPDSWMRSGWASARHPVTIRSDTRDSSSFALDNIVCSVFSMTVQVFRIATSADSGFSTL